MEAPLAAGKKVYFSLLVLSESPLLRAPAKLSGIQGPSRSSGP